MCTIRAILLHDPARGFFEIAAQTPAGLGAETQGTRARLQQLEERDGRGSWVLVQLAGRARFVRADAVRMLPAAPKYQQMGELA